MESSIEESIFIKASRERVWASLGVPQAFGEWFGGQVSGAFVPGERVQMTLAIKGHEGVQFEMVMEEVVPREKLSWRWHPGLPKEGLVREEPQMTLVEIRLADAEGGTQVTVVETGFDRLELSRRAKQLLENTKGWQGQLQNLKNHAEKQ